MRVYRSHVRMFFFGIAGVILIVGALDVMFGHWLSTPPQQNEGVLTTRGSAQQRGDIVWGAAMMGVGTLLVGGAVADLVRRRPRCVIGPEGIQLAIGSQERSVTIEWEHVRAVYSGTRVDPYDGTEREQLIVSLADRGDLPPDPFGAVWEGNDLVVDAHDWTKDLSVICQTADANLVHAKRMDDLRQMQAPSLDWETTVESPKEDADEQPVESEAVEESPPADSFDAVPTSGSERVTFEPVDMEEDE